MSETTVSAPYTGRTAWARNLESPLRSFLNTETGSSTVVLAAVAAALIWANVDVASYERVWNTELSLRLDGWGLGLTLRDWINSGLMTFFFLVVGLEARREFDLGELRERRRLALPFASGVGGMIVPISIYLAFTAGKPSAHGWGAAMSTDTALALGMLALVGSRFPERLRAFILTAAVVDDLGALVVIAVAYSASVELVPILIAIGIFAGIVALRAANIRLGRLYLLLGIALWIALYESGVDPVITGVAVGLIMLAYPASRPDLEHATDVFRLFREQPTPELARSARWSIETSLSPNDRLQALWHPWTSYVIVPLFALANAGITISGGSLARAFSSPVTLGILVGYVVGKPIGFVGAPWLVTRLSRGRIRPPVGWAALAGGGTIAGIGFTVSLLISTLAFSGDELENAKIGLLSAGIAASGLTWLVFRATAMLPRGTRLRALLGGAEPLVDLAEPVDTGRDHIRGPQEAPVTVVEYGDFECPYCGQAEPVVRELLRDFGDVRYVWRHLPLNDVHPNAQLAALAAEAADEQGAFWELHDLLLAHQDALSFPDLVGYADQLGLDVERFEADLRGHAGAAHVAEDVDTADLSSVSGTPTFFVNGRRHYGAYDIASLSSAIKAARARAAVAAG